MKRSMVVKCNLKTGTIKIKMPSDVRTSEEFRKLLQGLNDNFGVQMAFKGKRRAIITIGDDEE